MPEIKVNSSDLKAFQDKVNRLDKKLDEQDRKRLHKRISVYLLKWVDTNFKTEGGKVGGWQKLKLGGRPLPRSQRTETKQLDSSAKVLQDTGQLRRSFVPFSDSNTAGVGSEIGKFDNLPYAKKHHEGHGALPRRQLIPTVNQVGDEILEMYEEYIEQVVNE